MNKFAQVVLGVPVDRPFTYSIPEGLKDSVGIGQRVEVPFGRRVKTGYVVGFQSKTAIPRIRPLNNVLDREPFLDKEMLQLTRSVADYYCAGWGEVIEAAYPAGIRKRKRPLPELTPLPSQAAGASKKHSLTSQQDSALKMITADIRELKHQVFLLHGITASGKTEIYLQAIESVLARGSSSIVLVPEISLTPQTIERFRARFGGKVAVMHSRLLSSQRISQWQRIKNGQASIVIGARSAVFAPVKNLGLIIVDEEHETSYKQNDPAPRYHAREVAVIRAKQASAVVVLGSATPSVESFYNAEKNRIKLLSLTRRVTRRDLPKVDIVDMRREVTARKRKVHIFSRAMEMKIRQMLRKSEQAILFLNRRGFSTFINCAKCGYVLKCKRCQVCLTYHYASRKLICHYCNFSLQPPRICPQCSASYLKFSGLGTEKVESELYRLFPQARIARLDSDVTVKREAHKKILSDFKEGRTDILIGTQMVAKGLDFPRVSMVGVVSADTALNVPDFRSGERTFNLLTQVAGRAGRGQEEGQVVIQTYVPEHYAVVASTTHDYRQFYRQELKSRRELDLPPFYRLITLTLRSQSQKRVEAAANELSVELEKRSPEKGIRVLGPAPAMIARIRGNFCWNILLKGKDTEGLVKLLKLVLKDFRRYKGVKLGVDVDPV
jgi:primosomal protein N' (replication factor Y)